MLGERAIVESDLDKRLRRTANDVINGPAVPESISELLSQDPLAFMELAA
jgi:hypothetical protein